MLHLTSWFQCVTGRIRHAGSALVLLALTGCVGPAPWSPPPDPALAEAPGTAPSFDHLWESYAAWAQREPLRRDCSPRRVEPTDGTPLRGTVLMLHGFSACPQQYFELADLLAERGFRSLIALLPGHGRVPDSRGEDDVSGLPTDSNWQESFDNYADTLNSFMRRADGQRVLVGLSGGGSVALHTALAAPQVYDRVLVLAPFFDIAAPRFASALIAGAGSTPGLRSLDASPFGSERRCLDKVAQGKASYCEWQLKHVRGMQALGASVARRLEARPYPGRIQFVGVEGDKTVSSRRLRRVMLAHDGPTASACVYPQGVPHSMFSRFDNPGVDMYWLADFHAAALAYIGDGRSFPDTGESETLPPISRCRLTHPPGSIPSP